MSHEVDLAALRNYASTTLPHYKDEAAKFGNLVNQADVSDNSWGLIGLAVKQTYTSKLDELKQLMDLMKQGLDAFDDKMTQAADIYDGKQKDAVIKLGKTKVTIDGPL